MTSEILASDRDTQPGVLSTATASHMLDFSGVHNALVAISISADGVDGFAEGLSDGGFAAIVNLSLTEEDLGLFGGTGVKIKVGDVTKFWGVGLFQSVKVAQVEMRQ